MNKNLNPEKGSMYKILLLNPFRVLEFGFS
jgi:hypothetical protein